MNRESEELFQLLKEYRNQVANMQLSISDTPYFSFVTRDDLGDIYLNGIHIEVKLPARKLSRNMPAMFLEYTHDALYKEHLISYYFDLQKIKSKDSDKNSDPNQECESLAPDDYVTIEKDAIKEWEIPETIAIPVGKNKVRMKTSDFLALLGLIISIIISIVTIVSEQTNQLEDAQTTQHLMEIEEKQTQLEQEQNELLQNFLNSVDASMSSQAEAIEELIESTQNLHLNILELSNELQTNASAEPNEVADDSGKSSSTESEN